MKTLKTIILSVGMASLLLVPAIAQANNQKIDESLKAAEGGQLRFKIVDGDVDFKHWDKQTIRVVGELGDNNQQLVFFNDGTETVIKIETEKGYYNRSHNGWSGSDTKLEVFMPADTKLFAQGTSGDFSINGLTNGVKVKNVSGDISIFNSQLSIEAYSSSGDIRLENCQGEIHVEAVSGDVDAVVNANRFEVSTISGDLMASIGNAERVEVSSVSGDIELELALADSGTVEGSTVSGDIELVFNQRTLNAHFDLTTGPGGDIDNGLTADRPKESWVQAEILEFKVGKGSALVELETVSGTIEVLKK